MTNPTPLSSAAQAVLNAVKEICPAPADEIAATALRVAAYQVAPARPLLDSCCEHFEQAIRHKLLAIAAELEGAQ